MSVRNLEPKGSCEHTLRLQNYNLEFHRFFKSFLNFFKNLNVFTNCVTKLAPNFWINKTLKWRSQGVSKFQFKVSFPASRFCDRCYEVTAWTVLTKIKEWSPGTKWFFSDSNYQSCENFSRITTVTAWACSSLVVKRKNGYVPGRPR